MRHDASPEPSEHDDLDSPCFTVRQDDSSRNVTDASGAPDGRDPLSEHPAAEATAAPLTSGEAVRLAIKLAVDAGEYERAAALLSVLQRTTVATAVSPIDLARRRQCPKSAG